MNVGSAALADVCEITMGQAPTGETYNSNGDGWPLVAGAGDFGALYPEPKKYTTASKARLCHPGDVILAIRATVGARVLADSTYCLGRGVAGLRPSSALHDRYLWHWLDHAAPQLVAKGRGATFLQVSRADIAELPIPLAPIEEQRRIAAVLDAADALRAKRREALARLGALPRAVFIDMFGDPVRNPMGWTRSRLGDVIDGIDSGRSPVCLSRPAVPGEWGVLKLGAVTWGEYDERENKALPESLTPDPSLEVRQGDLLFTRKNTRELVGATAYVYSTRSMLLLSDLIFRFRVKSRAIAPQYLDALLSIPSKRKVVQSLAGGSAGSMPNISKARLADILIERPPFELQEEYVARLDALRRLLQTGQRALVEMDALFASLQQRAFRGNL